MTEGVELSGLPNDMIICIINLLDDLVDCIYLARTCKRMAIIWGQTLPKLVQINQACFDDPKFVYYAIKVKNYGLNMSPDICYTRSFTLPNNIKRDVFLHYNPDIWTWIDFSLATTTFRKFTLIEFSDRWELSSDTDGIYGISVRKKSQQIIGRNKCFSAYYTFIIHAPMDEEFKQKYWEAFNGPVARKLKTLFFAVSELKRAHFEGRATSGQAQYFT